MGNDSDFGIGPFVPISARDEEICRRAHLAGIWIRPHVHDLILSVAADVAGRRPMTPMEDFEAQVLAELAITYDLDEGEWRLPVLVVMAKWRAEQTAV